jgi:hypothetical protein
MKRAVATLLLTAVLLAGCGADPDTPEAQIESLFDRAEHAAEAADVGALRDMVSDAYSDEFGYDRRTVLRLAQLHILQHRSVHLLRQTRELSFPQPDRAIASVLVAMAGTPLPNRDALAAAHADLYRFDIELALENGDWVVTGAKWRRAQLSDFVR